MVVWDGSWVFVRYFSILLELGRFDNSKWLDMFKKRRELFFFVVFNRFLKVVLVIVLKLVMLVIIIWGFSFLISLIIKFDWRGVFIIVIIFFEILVVFFFCNIEIELVYICYYFYMICS